MYCAFFLVPQLSLASQVTPSHSPIVTSNSFSSQNSSISLSLPRCTLPAVVRARSKNVLVEKEVEDVSDSSSVMSDSRSTKQGKYRRESTPVANEKKQEKVKTKRRVLPVSLLKVHVHTCNSNVIQYLTLLSLYTITVLPLTTVYFVSEVHVHCTLNVLHSITP